MSELGKIKKIAKKSVILSMLYKFLMPKLIGNFVFSPLSYAVSLHFKKKYSFKKIDSYFKTDLIFCVGSGKSLDEIDLNNIRNSTVILLNGSVLRYKDFQGRGNSLVWFAQDVLRIIDYVEYVPESIPKIITLDRWRHLPKLIGKLDANSDVFFQPKVSFRYMLGSNIKDYQGLKSILPAYKEIGSSDSDVALKNGSFLICPKTVMLTSLYLALQYRPRKIITLGFDVPENADSRSYIKNGFGGKLKDKDKVSSFPHDIISKYQVDFLGCARKKGVKVFNASPLTSEKTFDKIECINKVYE